MADFLSDLASRAGLEGDQAHRGVGALLNSLKIVSIRRSLRKSSKRSPIPQT